jgi:topoisomerase-4 subunit A
VKSLKAKGKRLTTFEIAQVTEIEPNPEIEPAQIETDDDDDVEREVLEPDRSDDEVRDEIIGQERLFTDD